MRKYLNNSLKFLKKKKIAFDVVDIFPENLVVTFNFYNKTLGFMLSCRKYGEKYKYLFFIISLNGC